MLHVLTNLNIIVIIIMTAAYFYQLIYTVIGLVYKNKMPMHEDAEPHRFAALICARNESAVISEIIKSLKKQRYPSEFLDIYVLADNCTDNTAKKAERAGAFVYKRWNKQQVGKGYALDYLFKKIDMNRGIKYYDGYFIFDADNIVDENFVAEMNKTYSKGYNVVTSYRNSKNFAYNWITYGYSLWFLHEARFINYPRMVLGNGCAVSGTGFLVSSKIIEENKGWPFHLMTEDIQFSVNCAITGCKIGYCDKAIVYDEQPTTFTQSWTQRMRWAKGFYQVDTKYMAPLSKCALTAKGRKMTCYDILMTVAPIMLFSIFFAVFNIAVAATFVTAPPLIAKIVIDRTMSFIFLTFLSAYIGLLIVGLLTVVSEWDRIHATSVQKLIYLPIFPLFIATYIPIALAALVMKVDWKPIHHFSCSEIQSPINTENQNYSFSNK
ncbi:MAG: glycosyltransferase family 2 protein [Clostridia bacterium]|nr:glycosyltransferase family 2 protein [Clostridia bacterium]